MKSILKIWNMVYKPIIYLIILTFVYDIFFMTEVSEKLILILSLFIILMINKYKPFTSVIFFFALLLIITSVFFLLITLNFISQKLASWGFILLIIGAYQLVIESRSPSLKKLSLDQLYTIFKERVINNKALRFKLNQLETIIFAYFKKVKKFSVEPQYFIDYMALLGKLIIVMIVGLFILKGLLIIKTKIDIQINIYQMKQLKLRLIPKISKIEPIVVYRTTKVIIFGKNLSFRAKNNKITLMSQFGEVEPDSFDNDKIIFTVPFSWPDGNIYLGVKKKASFENRDIMVQSGIIKIKVIPTSSSFSTDDDAFFNQLKYLDKETLQINGYSPQTK